MTSDSIPRRSIPPSSNAPDTTRLPELAGAFLRIGITAFGGPAAHVALMRDEFVRRRGWIDDSSFIDLLGAANLIPGPTSTELAMHIGHRRAGWRGLIVAGLAFLLPAVLIVGLIAGLYVEVGQRPEIGAILIGITPVVVAIVAHAGWSIGRTVLGSPAAIGLFAASILAVLAGWSEIIVLLGAGFVAILAAAWLAPTSRTDPRSAAALVGLQSPAALAPVAATVSIPAILVTFLKIGTVLFGSGYVLIALLRSELVDGLHWLTERQLIDAVAVGQATPGPLFSTATFIGYVLAGPIGALAATIGVFLPAFVAVALSIPLLERLRRSVTMRAFLDGVNIAAVGLIALVAGQLAVSAARDVLAVGTGIAAFLLLAAGVGTGRLIAAGAVLGLIRLAWMPA